MDIRRLRYFLAVADSGHITRAAEQLGLQQPPLSQQIRALEEHLGVALFKRHAKGVTLTHAGLELQGEARRIVDSVDRLEQRMRQLAGAAAWRWASPPQPQPMPSRPACCAPAGRNFRTSR